MGFVTVVLGCCVWIPLCVWIWSIIGWMITGEMDVISGIAGIWIAIGLGWVCLQPPRSVPIASPLAFAAVVGTVIVYPFVRVGWAKRELKSVEIDALQRAYDALSLKPGNPASKIKIARQIYGLGMPGHALVIAENVIGQLPEQYFRDEHRMLKSWRQVVKQPDHFRPIACVECGTMNQPGNIHCAACGAPFLLDRAKGRFVGKTQGRKLMAVWFTLVAIVGVMPATAALPPYLAIVAIITLLCAGFGMVFYAFFGAGSQD